MLTSFTPSLKQGYKWNHSGASANPCNEIYAGPVAFAAPEPRAISKYILSRKHVVSFVDLHSFGQLCEYENIGFWVWRGSVGGWVIECECAGLEAC